ncbi:hypothetical protein MTR67_022289 [Solanum verrucosum]|uniref:Uncharacterized protein n=1 Tax=Solanum verrucosum TaxID=315347 RepID=A0AAF0QRL3_SOLVR|nr:hypothetical protein MTR67_022289 [Solanum verrucosum]
MKRGHSSLDWTNLEKEIGLELLKSLCQAEVQPKLPLTPPRLFLVDITGTKQHLNATSFLLMKAMPMSMCHDQLMSIAMCHHHLAMQLLTNLNLIVLPCTISI